MRIAVYGAGGVGGYFGGRLAQAGADVRFIARGAHLQALREQGLRVRSVTGDFEVRAPATDDPAEVGSCDFVLFCVKTFDTDAAAARLGPLVGEDTAVVSLQNGVENEEKLARAGAKLAFICAQAGMTAAVRLPIGEIRTAAAAWAAFSRLLTEVCAVAEAEGHPVPQAARERALALAQALPGSFSSLHDDLVAGRRMELEALHGFVVRRAAQHHLVVPMSEAVYAILQPWAIRNQPAST